MVTDTTPVPCPTVESQLEIVTRKINEFDSQKLADLKAELEAVKKKKEEAVKDYAAKFEALRKLWCEQNDHILSIRRDLIGAFPEWRKLIEECVCKELTKLRKEEKRIQCRSEVKGRLEAARDEALRKRDAAQAAALGWGNAAKALQDQLAANGKTIEMLCKLTCTPERPKALYHLWLKLMLPHARIRPVTDCFTVPANEMPDALCPPGDPVPPYRGCDPYEPPPPTSGECVPPPDDEPAVPPGDPEWPRGAPWLVSPDDYAKKIDCAYYEYQKAKNAYGTAEHCFRTDPDDLKAVKEKLKALAEGLDDAIESCLKTHKDKPCCDAEDEEKKAPGETDPCHPKQKGA